MKLLQYVIKDLCYAGLRKEQFDQVQEDVKESNRKLLISWSISMSLFWIMSLIMSLNSDAFADCRAVYASALIICIVTLISAIAARHFPLLINPAKYLFDFAILGAGIGIAICQPDVRTITMYVMAVFIPVCFIERTLTIIGIQIAAVISYILLAKGIIADEIYSWGLLNQIIFSIGGIMVCHVSNKARYERYLYAETTRQLAEIQMGYAYHDQMTRLQNRRAYAEQIERMKKDMPERFCVIIADVNGLKDVNDSLGHDAGDELIIAAADCLTAAFDHTELIYRTGGDEFCIITEGEAEEAQQCIDRLAVLTAEWNGQYIHGISISCGMATNADSSDLDAIVQKADSIMYEHKRAYYQTHGRK